MALSDDEDEAGVSGIDVMCTMLVIAATIAFGIIAFVIAALCLWGLTDFSSWEKIGIASLIGGATSICTWKFFW